MSNNANGWDLLIYGFGDEAYLIARLREMGGQCSELPEAPPMNKRHMHRLVRHCQAHGTTHHLDAVP
jgi:hypothetical protein